MSIEQMREALKNAKKYQQAAKWIHRVDGMSDNQVIAVYYKMRDLNEL